LGFNIYKLHPDFRKSNPVLLALLALFSCALLIDVSVAKWVIMPPSIMIMFILVCLQYINFTNYWWASISTVMLFLLMLGPDFPRLANHGNLAIFICIITLVLYIRKVICRKSISYNTVTLSFRYSLVTIYFIAGFHKLNSGFFSISGSCSTYVSQNLNAVLFGEGFMYPDYMIRCLQIGTIIIEMVIPFGILFYKTRKITAWILLLFHAYLSFCGFSNFSAFAGFLLAGCLFDLNQSRISIKIRNALKVFIFIAIVSSLKAYFFKRFELSSRAIMLMANGILINIGLLYFFYYILKENIDKRKIHNTSLLPYIFIFLITIWGLQGYFGLSNTSTLTMFSNLVTEESRSNHYIINTAKCKIWNFEEDFVTILELPQDSDWGRYYKIENYDLPLLEFKKVAASWVKDSDSKSKLQCKILYRGNVIQINDLAKSEYSKPKWWHNFIYYRRIPKGGFNQCQW
jgi:hypothetical protein